MRRALLLLLLLALLPMPVMAQDEIPDLRDDIRSCWDLDEVSGTRYDKVGYANLSDMNTVTHVLGISPQTRYGANFVAANAEYFHGGDVLDFVGSFSIAGWVKWTNPSYASLDYVVNNYTGQYHLALTSNPSIQFRVNTSYAQKYRATYTGIWYFLYAYYDAESGTMGLSIDNDSPVTANVSTAPYYGSDNFQVGGLSDSIIDSLVIWGRTLSDDELVWLYNNGIGRNCTEITRIYDDNPRELITLSSGNIAQFTRTVSYGDVAVAITVLMLVGLTLVKEFREFIHSHTENKS